MEKKQKILLGIPLAIIAGLLIYSWTTFLLTDMTATWRNYLALGFFAVLVYPYFKSFAKTIIGTGFYLLLATFNAFSQTPQKITFLVWISNWANRDTTFALSAFTFTTAFSISNFKFWYIGKHVSWLQRREGSTEELNILQAIYVVMQAWQTSYQWAVVHVSAPVPARIMKNQI